LVHWPRRLADPRNMTSELGAGPPVSMASRSGYPSWLKFGHPDRAVAGGEGCLDRGFGLADNWCAGEFRCSLTRVRRVVLMA